VVQDPAIDRALAELSVDHRAVVVCRVLLGFSEAHTAEVLGIRPGTVKSRLSRALTRLNPLLAPLHAPTEEDPR
jgi:RNA polymerase sigma-70 factor (ECF subfamily)